MITNKIKLLSVFVTLIYFQTNAQIINIESLRKVTDTTGWSGSIGLNVQLAKNTKTFFKIDNRIHVQHKSTKSIILFMNDIDFERYDGSNIVSSSIQHLRYNHILKPKIVWEAFIQTQYNAVSKIKFRSLFGTGPRFKLSSSEKYKIYLGTLMMYEYDKTDEEISIVNRDFRWSTYFSFSLYPSDKVTVVSTTYYQPKIDKFNDYRISSESSIRFNISEKLAFKSTFEIYFDEFPVIGIPKTQYNFTNGLVYSFD